MALYHFSVLIRDAEKTTQTLKTDYLKLAAMMLLSVFTIKVFI